MTVTNLGELTILRQREVEKLLAASTFVDPQLAIEQCGWLSPDVFTDEPIKKFWAIAKAEITPGMNDAHTAIAKIALEAGLIPEILGWIQDVYTSQVPSAYAQEIIRRAYITNISPIAFDLIGAIRSGDDQKAREVITKLDQMRYSTGTKLENALDLAEYFQKIVTEGRHRIETFIPPIDAATGGLERKTLTIIAGRTSMGKTSLASQITRNVAQSGRLAIYFSMEDSKDSWWARAACPLVGYTWLEVGRNKYNKAQLNNLFAEAYTLAGQYAEHLSIIETKHSTDEIWRIVAENRPALFVVDHIRNCRDKADNENKRLGVITENLKDIAKTFDCACIGLSQLNRDADKRSGEDKKPQLSDLRDSGEIEENADLVMMIYREDYYNPTNNQGPGYMSPTELWIRKFRNGPSGVKISLLFDPRKEWFEVPERR